MRACLTEANRDLLHQIEVVRELIGRAPVCGELTPYVGQVMQLCAGLRLQALRNLRDLEYGLDETLPDVLAATQRLTELFELTNTRLAPPIVRSRADDRLVLLVLRWLHDSHPKTALLPFGLSDNVFGMYPTERVPPVYYCPASRQTTLLYLALFFHEFGHLLYQRHKPELDDLVREFQQVVSRVLAPQAVGDPAQAARGEAFRQRVLTAWFDWIQEFYCDAVGLTVGGPAFLKAFSHFFRTRSNAEYYLPRADQLASGHPVTWLRTRMLVDRARSLGHATLADAVETAWAETARTIGVTEDYEGTWADEFFVPLRDTLTAMLEESQPYRHREADTDVTRPGLADNPVGLCNRAWHQFETAPGGYRAWERGVIQQFLAAN